jgi:hypothetical protein
LRSVLRANKRLPDFFVVGYLADGDRLAYWAIGVTACSKPSSTGCLAWGGTTWDDHSPAFLVSLFDQGTHISGAIVPGVVYILIAAVLFVTWLLPNVNSNSLHQLYRDRLGSAFLIRRNGDDGALEGADRFKLSGTDEATVPSTDQEFILSQTARVFPNLNPKPSNAGARA